MSFQMGHISPNTGKSTATRPLLYDEIQQVKIAVQHSPRDRALFALGLQTGLRASDLREIKFSDIVNGELVLRERKTSKRKVIKLNDDTLLVISAWHQECSFEHIASGQRGQMTVGSIARLVKDWAGRAGLDTAHIASHTLRKSRARALIEQFNEPLYLVMRDLNHHSELQTCAYLGITTKDQARLYSHSI